MTTFLLTQSRQPVIGHAAIFGVYQKLPGVASMSTDSVHDALGMGDPCSSSCAFGRIEMRPKGINILSRRPLHRRTWGRGCAPFRRRLGNPLPNVGFPNVARETMTRESFACFRKRRTGGQGRRRGCRL